MPSEIAGAPALAAATSMALPHDRPNPRTFGLYGCGGKLRVITQTPSVHTGLRTEFYTHVHPKLFTWLRVTQRVQVSLWYILIRYFWGLSIYHNDTWTLWVKGLCSCVAQRLHVALSSRERRILGRTSQAPNHQPCWLIRHSQMCIHETATEQNTHAHRHTVSHIIGYTLA